MEQKRNNIFTKSDEELIKILARYWKVSEEVLMKPFKVIASFKKADKKDINDREYGYFVDVRNLNGDILYYPQKRYGPIKVFSLLKNDYLANDIIMINVRLASRNQREKHNNPFMLKLENDDYEIPAIDLSDRIQKEKLIRKLFNDIGSTPKDAQIISNALRAIMGDLYTETERFVFELLQNADDQPNNGDPVNVMIKALKENLLFLHTGKPFRQADVESISSIGDSTKDKDTEKTGYKGIGFKSVFSDAETVYIDSGNFSFAFDRNSPVYPENENMDQVPWQIKPIWEERYRLPKEIQKENMYFHAPVGIALSVGSTKIENYNTIIPKLLSEPRFTLFLRNINKIYFSNLLGNSIVVSKDNKIDGTIVIESNGEIEKWVSKDYLIDIPAEIRDSIQFDKQVPVKLKESTKTKITFAAKITDGAIEPISNAVLFNYLPTKEHSFGFKFLVNADFLTVSNRESIHFKNVWNRFLFSQIGSLLLDWISSLSNYKGSLSLLPMKAEESDNILSNDFYNALKQSIEQNAFIKGHDGDMHSIKDIMLDKSGLSSVIGKDLFCQIVNPSKTLPMDEYDEVALKESTLFEDIEEHKPLSVLDKIKLNVAFHKWFLAANEELKNIFYVWLIKNNTEKRKPSIVSLVENLPIYKFGDSYYYKKEVVEDPNKFVIRSPHKSLEPIFEVCGYECSGNIDEHPLVQFYSENVIKSTFPYIFDHLLARDAFIKWLTSAPLDDLKILIDWLVYQDRNNHIVVSEFINKLPLVVFDDAHLTKKASEDDAQRIIINSKLEPIKPILEKLGLKCSDNIESSPFVGLLTLPKEIDLFKKIKEKVGNVLLTPNEKLNLFKTLKQLDGVNDIMITQMCLFSNHTGSHRKWLSIMTSFSPELPVWMHAYAINEKENFQEVQQYLVKKEREFEEIVKNNIDEIIKTTFLKEVYLRYKDSWTLEFTKSLINKYGTTEMVLDMVELQDSESQKFFLDKVDRLELNIEEVCVPDTRIYRILLLAFQIYSDEELSNLAGRIWIGQRTLSSFMVSDEISFEYHESKTIHLPLEKLLPSYNETEIVSKIRKSLSAFDSNHIGRLLSLKQMDTRTVLEKIDLLNGYSPYSYLLAIYRTRKVLNYSYGRVPYINLAEKTDIWVAELLSILYEQKVELYPDCFGYRLSEYFSGYFSNEYINEDEKILKSIEDWANSDDKRSYLKGLGVRTERTKLIQARKALVNNEVISDGDLEVLKENLSSTIQFVRTKGLLPFSGTNQIISMCKLELILGNRALQSQIDIVKLSSNSDEYDLLEYHTWKETSSFTILLYEGKMPYQLVKTDEGNLLICSYNIDDFYYNPNNKSLYVNKNCEIRDILYSIVSNPQIPFTAKDWQLFYYDNLVSKTEVESRDQEIENLRRELQEYIDKFGKLSKDKDVSNPNETKNPNDKDDTETKKDKDNDNDKTTDKTKDEDPTIKKGKDQEMPKSDQIAAQLEAQQFLMKEMPEWHYPSHYGEYNKEEGKPYYFSTVKLNDSQGKPILIVLKSYKKQDEPFKINPTEWESIIKESAFLLIYTGEDIKRITKEDLVKNQSNISLSFSTENLDIEDRISAFCSSLHYFKELHFDFKSFNLSESAESIKNIFKKNEGTQNSNTEEDL